MKLFGQRYSYRQSFLIFLLLCLFIILTKLYRYLNSNASRGFQPHLNVEDVRQLLRAGDDADINIRLFDPLILEAWKSNDYLVNPGSCLFLCHVIGPLSFAVTEAEIREKPYFFSRLAQLGFTVTQFFNSDEKKTHIFLTRSGSALHIVILHWSNAGYWRQYQLSGSPHHMAVVKQFITIESWIVLNTDRAYERFETRKGVVDGFKLSVPTDIDHFVSDFKSAKFIPCNETQANYFYSKYPEDTSEEAKRFQHLAWKVLAKSKTILDRMGVPFWISSGTLLGFFRQCKMIPWAMDVDLGIFIEDYNSHLVSKFEQTGLKLSLQFGKVEDSFELSFKENDIKVDLFFFYTEGATMWNGGTQARTGKKFKYVFPHFTLCWTEFLDLKVRVPCQTLDYIEANYGKSWSHPVKHWDWKASPPNVRENGVWPEEERHRVVVIKDL